MLRRHTVWVAMLGALALLAFTPWGAIAQEAAKAPETVPFTKELADQLANSKVAARGSIR